MSAPTAFVYIDLGGEVWPVGQLWASAAKGREVASDFGIKAPEAKAIIREVAGIVSGWREEATALGLRSSEIDRMATAFEHEDLDLARQFRSRYVPGEPYPENHQKNAWMLRSHLE